MLGVHQYYTIATRTLHVLYTYATRIKLGKITYLKIAYILCVFLYFYAILLRLLYRNSALGIHKVAVGTVGIKCGR